MRAGWPIAAAVLVAAGPAIAQDGGPRFCPNRPSLESSACTTEPGRVQLEVSAIDWTLDDGAGEREDTILAGDFLARFGVGPATELQLQWSPYGHDRTRDKTTGEISRANRVGDVRLAVRHAFQHPDGKGLSFGVEPFVTVPVGRRPIGDGTWSAGVVAPITYDLTDKVNIGFTAEADAQAGDDGDGRHFAGSGIGAVSYDLTKTLSGTLELEVLRDLDPSGHTTQALLGTAALWKFARTRAVYAEAVTGLNRDSPDVRVYGGLAAVF